MNARTILITVGGLLVSIAALLVGVQIYENNLPFQGSLIEPSPPAVNFELTQVDGSPYKLSERKGQVVLIFFGYANCPDVCPATLSEFKKMHVALEERAEMVDFVFISVDPERDTPEDIDRYVSAFNSDFIGLSGDESELQKVWDGYWVFREKEESESELGYLMAHTARIYAIDKNGKLRLTFPFGLSSSAMTRDVARLLSE